ncbi:MAG: family 43 glycosylhydrolase [Acidobacteriota bacterium]|nr:family 43 glycosylhydrolase [Acidobacteriota bacterium]
MKVYSVAATVLALLPLAACSPAFAQLAGEPYIHDPSTVIQSEGKYYTFGTRGGGLISDDGYTWHAGAERPGGGVAPDVIKLGDRYYVAYAVGGGGMNGGHASNVKVMWNKTLDPKSPDFKFQDVGVVASSNGVEDCDAIDPAFLYAKGHLWLSYGTYFGFIRIVELDPKTGKRLVGNKPVDAAIDMEATDLMYRDGWYYLLGTHGTCCDGANSTYNIRVGRSRNPTGPYLDHMGIPLLKGGGKLVAGASNRHIGLGHFGLLDLGDDVQKFSMHYEADMDRDGRSVLDIRPLMWRDGWPVGGDHFEPGTYEIQSERSGGALELAVDFVRIETGRMRWGPPTGTVKPIANQTLDQDSAKWPAGIIPVDMNDYMVRPHQLWTITPVPDAGGYPGDPYFKITIAGTDRALAATANGDVQAVPSFSGAPEQLWRIDQLIDGTYRILPKATLNTGEPLALTAIGAGTPALIKFDPKSDRAKWNFRKP